MADARRRSAAARAVSPADGSGLASLCAGLRGKRDGRGGCPLGFGPLLAAAQEPRDDHGGRDHQDAAHCGRDLEALGERLAGGLEHVGGERLRQPAATSTAPPSVSLALAAASAGTSAGIASPASLR